MSETVILVGMFVNIMISSGVLYRIIDFARWAGKQDEKHESHERRLGHHDDRIQELERVR